MNTQAQVQVSISPPSAGSGSAFKIALILTLMVLFCLASVSQAGALDGRGRLSAVEHVFAFANRLLEPAVEQSSVRSPAWTEAAGVVPGTTADAADEPATAGADEPAYMPFMSFEHFSEEQQ